MLTRSKARKGGVTLPDPNRWPRRTLARRESESESESESECSEKEYEEKKLSYLIEVVVKEDAIESLEDIPESQPHSIQRVVEYDWNEKKEVEGFQVVRPNLIQVCFFLIFFSILPDFSNISLFIVQSAKRSFSSSSTYGIQSSEKLSEVPEAIQPIKKRKTIEKVRYFFDSQFSILYSLTFYFLSIDRNHSNRKIASNYGFLKESNHSRFYRSNRHSKIV